MSARPHRQGPKGQGDRGRPKMPSEPLLGAVSAIPLRGRAVWPLVLPATRQHGARAQQEHSLGGGRMAGRASPGGSGGIVSALGVGEGENGL